MKKLARILITIFATAACAGGAIGCYIGVKQMIADNKPELPANIVEFYSDATSATALETESEYILSAYEVSRPSTTSYYYELESARGFSGKLRFAIGVTDLTVTNYKFLENVDENSLGLANAQNSGSAFIGYTTGSDVVLSGTTITKNAMLTAINAALEDAQGR